MENKTIFVQIASYRDNQLGSTIEDLFRKALFRERLKVCVCRQFDPLDEIETLNYEKLKNDKRIKWINVHHSESKGACWARNLIQQHYDGEDYTLQIDSHMRFIEAWDLKMIQMIEKLRNEGFAKPIITGYMPPYYPKIDDETARIKIPTKMVINRFTEEGILIFGFTGIENHENIVNPVRARFYSAHFTFADGKFSVEVQHDPNIYFLGEEITIAVRAFTHGYDLFHPHVPIAWHYYERPDSKRHPFYDKKSFAFTRKLLGIRLKDNEEETSVTIDQKYSLGKVRSLRDYEKYAGVLFSERKFQKCEIEPPFPCPATEEEWLKLFPKRFFKKIEADEIFFDCPQEDYILWEVLFYESKGGISNPLCTIRIAGSDFIKKIPKVDGKYNICVECEIPESSNPCYWEILPTSMTKGSRRKVSGEI